MNYIKNKVIVVTGAGSGFGKLVTLMAVKMGGKVVCGEINKDSLAQTLEEAKTEAQEAGDASGMVTDVTKRDDVFALAKHAVDTFGRIDVMINNAGQMPLALFSDNETAWKAWDQCIDVNLKGTLYGMYAAHNQMMKQGFGHIINISSIFGTTPVIGAGIYGATKAGVKYLAEVLRQECQGKIKVTTVRPTGVGETKLNEGVLNMEAAVGLCGGTDNTRKYVATLEELAEGKGDPKLSDKNDQNFFMLDAHSIAENIIYVINQPQGVSISDITVRASGELYVA